VTPLPNEKLKKGTECWYENLGHRTETGQSVFYITYVKTKSIHKAIKKFREYNLHHPEIKCSRQNVDTCIVGLDYSKGKFKEMFKEGPNVKVVETVIQPESSEKES
jgi:hypothetical protein